MANTGRSSQTLIVVLAFVVGGVLGWLVHSGTPTGPSPQPTPTAVPQPTTTAVPILPTPTPPCPTPIASGRQIIQVGPDAKIVNPECLKINYKDTIRWTSLNPNTNTEMWIEFSVRPFEIMGNGTYQLNRVTCSSNTQCDSGRIQRIAPSDANIDPVTHKKFKEYKYWQIFHDKNSQTSDDVADARIIIQW